MEDDEERNELRAMLKRAALFKFRARAKSIGRMTNSTLRAKAMRNLCHVTEGWNFGSDAPKQRHEAIYETNVGLC